MSDTIQLLFDKKKKAVWQASHIELLYHECRNTIREYNEILGTDLTEIFWATIRSDIKFKHNTTILIRGVTTSGKSTVGLKIMHEQNIILEEMYKKKVNRYEAICSDQIEFVRFSNKGETNMSILIDEFSALGGSGFNASTELNSFQTINDIFAQRNILKVYCTPRISIYDNFANIILDVIGRNENEKTTTCKLSYNDFSCGAVVPLGVVNIKVGDILETEWYKRYRKKKFARMGLLDEYGVKDIRDLEFSELTIECYEKLKNLAKNEQKMPQEMVMLNVKSILQKNKLIYSIVAETELIQRIRGLVNSMHELEKAKRKKEKLEREISRPITKAKYEETEIKIKEYESIIKELEKSFKEVYDNEKKNCKILNEYRSIK